MTLSLTGIRARKRLCQNSHVTSRSPLRQNYQIATASSPLVLEMRSHLQIYPSLKMAAAKGRACLSTEIDFEIFVRDSCFVDDRSACSLFYKHYEEIIAAYTI